MIYRLTGLLIAEWILALEELWLGMMHHHLLHIVLLAHMGLIIIDLRRLTRMWGSVLVRHHIHIHLHAHIRMLLLLLLWVHLLIAILLRLSLAGSHLLNPIHGQLLLMGVRRWQIRLLRLFTHFWSRRCLSVIISWDACAWISKAIALIAARGLIAWSLSKIDWLSLRTIWPIIGILQRFLHIWWDLTWNSQGRLLIVHRVGSFESHWLRVLAQIYVLSNLLWHIILALTAIMASILMLLFLSPTLRITMTHFSSRLFLLLPRRWEFFIHSASIWHQNWDLFLWSERLIYLESVQVVVILLLQVFSLVYIGPLYAPWIVFVTCELW